MRLLGMLELLPEALSRSRKAAAFHWRALRNWTLSAWKISGANHCRPMSHAADVVKEAAWMLLILLFWVARCLHGFAIRVPRYLRRGVARIGF